MEITKEVVKYGSDVLRAKCEPVEEVTDELKRIIAEMIDLMHESNGVGLAAPQVGLTLRFFVYDVGDDKGAHAIINPKIVNKIGVRWDSEGCLSMPGLYGDVLRADKVVVTGLDENGNKVRMKASGLLSTCIQHETDHLDGVLFIDKADPETLHTGKVPGSDDDSEEEEE